MDKYIIMSQKEIKRYDIIKKVIDKELNEIDAAELLTLSARHIRCLKNKMGYCANAKPQAIYTIRKPSLAKI